MPKKKEEEEEERGWEGEGEEWYLNNQINIWEWKAMPTKKKKKKKKKVLQHHAFHNYPHT